MQENFWVFRLVLKDRFKGLAGLGKIVSDLMDISYLSPNVGRGERFRRLSENVFKALWLEEVECGRYGNRLRKLLLLFVYDTKSKVDFGTFAIIWIDVEHIRERFLGMIE